MLQHLASLESITRSLIATVVLVLAIMLVAGGLGISGPAILTFSIWISLMGLVVVGAFLIVRAQRSYAGAGAIVAAVAVWMAYFWRANPGPFVWPVLFIAAMGLIAFGTRGMSRRQRRGCCSCRALSSAGRSWTMDRTTTRGPSTAAIF